MPVARTTGDGPAVDQVYGEKGYLSQALAAAQRAVSLSEQTNQPILLGNATASVGAVYRVQGDEALAVPWLQRAVSAYESAVEPSVSLVETLQELGLACLATRRQAQARSVMQRAEIAAGQACASDYTCKRDASWWHARTLAWTGDPVAAKAVLERAGLTFYEWTVQRGDPPIAVNPFDPGHPSLKMPTRHNCKAPKQSDSGEVTDAAVVIGGLRGSFRDCYTTALNADPALSTSVRLVASIGADGGITRAESLHDKSLEPLVVCLMNALVHARFSPPEGGKATVVVPVTLVRAH